jgi:hypothetical protein
MPDRPVKITFAQMRNSGVRGILVYCSDYKRSHSIAAMADQWPADMRLSDLEPRFICTDCSKRGADVRPDFNWNVQGPRADRRHGVPLTPRNGLKLCLGTFWFLSVLLFMARQTSKRAEIRMALGLSLGFAIAMFLFTIAAKAFIGGPG